MELSTVAKELYGLPPKEFTAARNARATEARTAGEQDLAESLKQLRKPSSGASVANLLTRDQPREIERLVKVGANLRNARNLDGAGIRRATKEKAEIVSKLLRRAKSIAKGAGIPFSQSIEQEVEGTLDAAFSDPDSAQSLRDGCLTTSLHYSGLGFGSVAAPRRPVRANSDAAETAKAKQSLEQARSDAERADSELEKAQRAVKTAEADLQRLRAALSVATRQAARAHKEASSAQQRLDLVRNKATRTQAAP